MPALRDLLVQAVVYGSLPLIPFRPFLGLLVFSWLAYMRPAQLAWQLGGERFSYYVALATLLGMVIAMGRERIITIRAETIMLVAVLVWVGITVRMAVFFEPAKERYILFAKVVLIALLTTGLVRTAARFRALFLVMALSLGVLGLKYGLYGVLRGGVRFQSGPGGFMQDNNGLALGLVMAVPLVMAVAMTERSRLARIAAAVCAAFTMLAIFFTFSRGGFVALGVVGALLILRSGRPVVAALVVALGIAGFFYATSADFQESYTFRLESIKDYETDGAAQARLGAWQTAWRMSKDYPLFGVGPDNFVYLQNRYGILEKAWVTHNAFFQWLVDSGPPALGLFVGLLATSVWRLERLRRRTTEKNVEIYARMLQIAIAGYITGAMFLDKAYYDLIYQMIALGVCLEVAHEAEEKATRGQEVASSALGLPWWRQAPAMRFKA